MRGRIVHDLDGSTSLHPYGVNHDDVVHSVARNGLNAILLDAAEATGRIEIKFGQRASSVDFERSVIEFTDYNDAITRPTRLRSARYSAPTGPTHLPEPPCSKSTGGV